MFAVIAGVLFLISFVLHWAGKGTNPFDPTGVFYLGMIAVAVHLAITLPHWYHRRP
jgi:uncharacterized membrane protein YjdF